MRLSSDADVRGWTSSTIATVDDDDDGDDGLWHPPRPPRRPRAPPLAVAEGDGTKASEVEAAEGEPPAVRMVIPAAPPPHNNHPKRKRVKRKCSQQNCENNVVQGGVCLTHGARRKCCSHPRCEKPVWNSWRRGLNNINEMDYISFFCMCPIAVSSM